MRILKTLAIVVTTATLMGAANYVQASLVDIGPIMEGHSWYQQFYNYGNNWDGTPVGVVDQIEVFWVAGSTFKNPAISVQSGSGWSGIGNVAHGTPWNTSNPLYFTLTWNDPRINPTSFDLYLWNGATLKDWARVTWNGGWNFADIPDNQVHLAPIPEPTTMIAGALLLIPFGLSTVRMLRKSRKA